MAADKVCKTVHQYNREPVACEDMQKLLYIAEDYRKVKNYVYARFGGIGSLSKIYPGYTVQNEMTGSGYRETLGMPSVYFYLAIFDALADIKSQWTRTKSKSMKMVNKNKSFTEDEKHYLRFVLKVNNAFDAVLNRKPIELAAKLMKQYRELVERVDAEKLHRYLCRQVRKNHMKLHTDAADVFAIAERAYRYDDHGIYISIKEKRKRIYIPLTDNNRYKCQLRIKLYPQEDRVEIKVPVNVTVRRHADYSNQVGVAIGFYTMLTTDEGRGYGEELGRYQTEYSDWVQEQTRRYRKNKGDNPGRKKYYAKKRRLEEQLHSYINQELNRFLTAEKPKTIYIVKLPKPQAGGYSKKINYSVSLWQRGYIRKRLTQKCKEQSIEIVEVIGKGISDECSRCGGIGKKAEGNFICPICGYQTEEKRNTAQNVMKRGQGDGIVY
ncbi:MAG: transposase [Dorea sp.]|nr:transposase [Dorea sp.]